MPFEMTHYKHTDSRYAKMDREGRRCDGNNRRCTQRAVEQHLVRRRDPDNGRVTGEPATKQTCARHRQQFVNSALWLHITTSRMGGRAWPEAS